MAFLQRHFYTPETSFTPLFRLLEDFENYSREGNGHQPSRRSNLAYWQPKFDLRETESAYELHGELPGMNKENVYAEFTDSQSILIRGKVERAYTSSTPPAGTLEGTTMSGAIAESGKEQAKSSSETAQDEATKNAAEMKPTDTVNTDTAKYWLTERSFGEFSRTFNFPTAVNQDKVTARFKDGVLNITVPKASERASHRITIS